jgi:hypothetical protein
MHTAAKHSVPSAFAPAARGSAAAVAVQLEPRSSSCLGWPAAATSRSRAGREPRCGLRVGVCVCVRCGGEGGPPRVVVGTSYAWATVEWRGAALGVGAWSPSHGL